MMVSKMELTLRKMCMDTIVENYDQITYNENQYIHVGNGLADELFNKFLKEKLNNKWLKLFGKLLTSTLTDITIKMYYKDINIYESFLCGLSHLYMNTICFVFESNDANKIDISEYCKLFEWFLEKHRQNLKRLGFKSHHHSNRNVIDRIFEVWTTNEYINNELILEDFFYSYDPIEEIKLITSQVIEYGNDFTLFKQFLSIIGDRIQRFRISIHLKQYSFTKCFSELFKFKYLKTLMLHGIFEVYQESDDNQQQQQLYVTILLELPLLEELDVSIDGYKDNHINSYIISERANNLLKFIIVNKDKLNLKILDITGHYNIEPEVMRQILYEKTSLQSLRYLRSRSNFSDLFSQQDHVLDFWENYSFESCIKYLTYYMHCARLTYHILKKIKIPEDYFIENGPEIVVKILINIINDFSMYQHIVRIAGKLTIEILIKTRNKLTPSEFTQDSMLVVIKLMKIFRYDLAFERDGIILICSPFAHELPRINHIYFVKILWKYVRNHMYITDDVSIGYAFDWISKFVNKVQCKDYDPLCKSATIECFVTYIKINSMLAQIPYTVDLAALCLWNITDVCGCISQTFIALDGIKIFSRFVKKIMHNPIMYKIMGILCNISEIPHLRKHLLQTDVIKWIIECLLNGQLELSFFAAGTLANLAPKWKQENYYSLNIDFDQTMNDMVNRISTWGLTLRNRIVCYRNFDTMIPILHEEDVVAVQYWAIWTIRHVTKISPHKYFTHICEKELFSCICDIKDNHPLKNARLLAHDIVNFINTGQFLDPPNYGS